ncbi:DUF6427 family protein [Winogradskyella poriferorum]|uniref:DUF6427 family protein n=1 Tax=Winogradskyella poriferorum TaxID=307627 RepID=UPI003D64AFC5
MITSVFNKSKPINFIIVLAFVLVLFSISNFELFFGNLNTLFSTLTRVLVVVFLVFLLDFIVSKNNLTQRNSYAILVFGVALGVFPEIINNINLLLANVFILFALRRILSLSSNKQVKKKLFDASFWIALATLLYFWAILFFAIIIVALIYYSQNDLRNVLIPLVGVATVAMLLLGYNIIFHDAYIRPSNFERFSSLDYTSYNSLENIFKLTILFTAFIWTIIYFFRSLTDKNNKLKPSYFIVAWTSIIGILIAIISPYKDGSEFVFFIAPFAIIMANYIEAISEKWFKEVFVGIFILTPIIGLIL